MAYTGQIKKYLLEWLPHKIPTTGHWREEEFNPSKQIPCAQRTHPVKIEGNELTQSNSSSQIQYQLNFNAFCQGKPIPSPGSAHGTRHAQNLGFD